MLLKANLRISVIFLPALSFFESIKVFQSCDSLWVRDPLLLLHALDSRFLSVKCFVRICVTRSWISITCSPLLACDKGIFIQLNCITVREECSHRSLHYSITTLRAIDICDLHGCSTLCSVKSSRIRGSSIFRCFRMSTWHRGSPYEVVKCFDIFGTSCLILILIRLGVKTS